MSEAVLAVPETRQITKLVVDEVRLLDEHFAAVVVLKYLYEDGSEARKVPKSIQSIQGEGVERQPTPDAYEAFLGAIGTARPGETGGRRRRANFRILGHLSDIGELPGVTVTP